MTKTITVTGTGQVSVKPDLIAISIRLETREKEYDKTMAVAAERINALDKSLQEIGFEKKAVKTKSFNVGTNYENVKVSDGNYKRVLKEYVCVHNLAVEFDLDMKRLSSALAAMSACLAKPEFSVSFTVKDPTAVGNELLQVAARNAKEKADILCAASGVRRGELLSVNYSWGATNVCSPTEYRVESRRMTKVMASAANIEIEPDDIKASDSATFVWKIL